MIKYVFIVCLIFCGSTYAIQSNIITSNKIYGNFSGAVLFSGAGENEDFFISGNVLNNNQIYNNKNGIEFSLTFSRADGYLDKNIFVNNSIFNNINGIVFNSFGSAGGTNHLKDNVISNNSIFNNSDNGIYVGPFSFLPNFFVNNSIYNNSGAGIYWPSGTINYYGQNYLFANSGGNTAGAGIFNASFDALFGTTTWNGGYFGTLWTQSLNCNWMVNAINSQGQTLFPLSACSDPNFDRSTIRGRRNRTGDMDTKIIFGEAISNQKQPYQWNGGTFLMVSGIGFNTNLPIGDSLTMGGWIRLPGNPSFINSIPVVGGQTFTVDLWQQGYTNYEIQGDVTTLNGSIGNTIISVPLTFVGGNGLKTIRVRYTNGLLSSNWYQMTVNFQDLLVNTNASIPSSTSSTGVVLAITTDRTIAYQITGGIIGSVSGIISVNTGINLLLTSSSGNKNITVTLSSGSFNRSFNLSTLYSTAVSLTPVDLEITSLISNTTLNRGDPLSFNITYRNRGTTPATNVVLTFTGSSLLRDVTSNVANSRMNNTLIFTLGTLNSGAVGNILINSTVGAGSPGNWISNSMSITGDSEDTNPNNNIVLLNSQIANANSATTQNSASMKDPLDIIQQLYDINQNLIGQLPSSVPVSTDTVNNGYRSSIDTLLRYGIMKGYKFRSGRVAFSPNKNISVCEWRSIIDRMINLNGSIVNATNDSSCKNPKVGNKTITQSQAQQILEEKMGNAGHGSAQVEDLFDGGSSITRAEAANILVSAFRFEKDFLIGQNHQFTNLVYTKIQSRNIDQRRQFINRLIQKLNQFSEEDLSKIGLDKLKLLGDLTDALNGKIRSRSSNGAIQGGFDSLFN